MVLAIVILSVLAVGVVCAVIVTVFGASGVQEPVTTQSFGGLAAGTVRDQDLAQVRLDIAFRGYRMDQVDALLVRLGTELTERDAEIDRLRVEADDGHL
ncbi:MAG: DivIVA domain-containing protein [Ornithinimicrobium sp.]